MRWHKRVFDITSSMLLIFLLSPLFLALALIIRATSRGPILYWSSRVGKDNRLFQMPKFRSIRMEAPQVATHLLSAPATYLTPIGSFLCQTSLDELP